MCGIVGIASQRPDPEPDRLVSMRDTMAHRGPDDAGIWWSDDGCVGLAHRRLAIIDLSPDGHQPMLDGTNQICITFNGEIYNYPDLRADLKQRGHTFKSSSDTEVVLEAYREWGQDCLIHLNGMFALCIYDIPRRHVFLARDRAGEKPLFYRCAEGTLTFASELKALMAHPSFPRRLDVEALDSYLAFGYVPGDRCILQGVSKLPPAYALTFDISTARLEIRRYWDLPEPWDDADEALRTDEDELVEELDALLEDAVRRQLVADVPVGILLSGGVDSSLLTALAARVKPKVKTFTISFPKHDAYDESQHARLVARHFGTEHLELEAEPSTVDLIPKLAKQYDEPLVDSSMIPTFLVSNLVRDHCRVAIGGDGGDELFGGYQHYSRLLWLKRNLGWVPLPIRKAGSSLVPWILPIGFKGRNWLQAWGIDFTNGLPLIANHFDQKSRHSLVNPDLQPRNGSLCRAETVWKSRIPNATHLIDRAARMDFENYLPGDILVKVDRASMLNSLEVRAPLLDFRVIEFAFGKVPTALKVTASKKKILLKKLARRILPPGFDFQRKQGFSIPLALWIKGNHGDLFREVLLECDKSLFNRSFIMDLLSGQERGRSNAERLFGLVLFELWRREYSITV
jgi:asparagine synthase (glutamine-hydrolysing)